MSQQSTTSTGWKNAEEPEREVLDVVEGQSTTVFFLRFHELGTEGQGKIVNMGRGYVAAVVGNRSTQTRLLEDNPYTDALDLCVRALREDHARAEYTPSNIHRDYKTSIVLVGPHQDIRVLEIPYGVCPDNDRYPIMRMVPANEHAGIFGFSAGDDGGVLNRLAQGVGPQNHQQILSQRRARILLQTAMNDLSVYQAPQIVTSRFYSGFIVLGDEVEEIPSNRLVR